MPETLFAWLFKYRPVLFQEGEMAFAAEWPVVSALLVAGLVVGAAVFTYSWAGPGGVRGMAGGIAGGVAGAGPAGRGGRGQRLLLGGLRAGALGVLVFCLFRPTLVLTSVVPQRNFVAVLIDDSRSMSLPDVDGGARSDWAGAAFGAGEGGAGAGAGDLMAGLQERFAVRMFRFGEDVSRIGSTDELTGQGSRTDLATALDRAREELSGVPLSGVVVVSDGADNGGRPLAEALVPLQAASIPVYTVGLGEEALSPDLQMGRVELPRSVLKGSSLVVDVVLAQRGLGGRTVPLVVEDESRILAEEEVTLQRGERPTVARVRLTLEEAGPRRIRFRVPPVEGEQVAENNQRELLLDVREDTEKILYFEGELRQEVKFTRRAVEEDENLQVVALVQTAENKFWRGGVDDGDELAGGFPRTREELFRYRGLILGSVEASFFTRDQLAMIADFVSQRGGGLLVLGGRRALAEGGYVGTPVAEALPVVLEEPARGAAAGPPGAFTELRVRPTTAGQGHPATQIRPGSESAEALWDSLPPLSATNRVAGVKPGATALLVGEDDRGEERVVLAHHRYGRGKALAFPVQDAWIWQMHADIPVDDQTHENLWQQLLRWLVDGVPHTVEARPERERTEPGETLALTAEVLDSTYLAVNDARVVARVLGPDGSEEEVPLEWSVERDGEYAGSFTPTEPGLWQVAVEARRGEELLGSATTRVMAGDSDEEYFDAGQRRAVLERLARETGGRYYTAASAASLPEDIQYTGSGVTLTEERDLWDMPVLFLMLVGLLGAEWGLRRRGGLV